MRVSFLLSLSVILLLVLSLTAAQAGRHDRPASSSNSVLNLLRRQPLRSPSSISAPDPRYPDHVADEWISRRALVAFNESVSAQQKEDWLNSILFAQAACESADIDAFTQPKQFIACVSGNLTSLGWAVGTEATLRSISLTADQPLASDVIGLTDGSHKEIGPFPTSYQHLARAAVESLKTEDDGYKFFHDATTDGKTLNFFMLAVVSVTDDGLIAYMDSYAVTTKEQGYQVWWSTYPAGSASMTASQLGVVQVSSMWTEDLRQTLRDRLTEAKWLPAEINSKPIQL